MSSKDTNEERLIHAKSFNIETTINDKADQVIGEIFELFCSRYQIDFQIAMKCSSFLLDNVHSLHCKFHKVNLNCCGSYIIYPDQIKKKKKIVPINKNDDNCFQYLETIPFSHEEN